MESFANSHTIFIYFFDRPQNENLNLFLIQFEKCRYATGFN